MKNGRARFIDESTICLACPPNQILEDKKVKNNNTELSMEYVLTRIDQILEDKNHIEQSIEFLNDMELNDSYHGGMGDQARADAIGHVVTSREATNQQILKMLDKMYDDLKAMKKA